MASAGGCARGHCDAGHSRGRRSCRFRAPCAQVSSAQPPQQEKVVLEPSEGLSRRTSVSSRCRHANHRGLITLQAPERVVGHRQGRSAADASRVDPTAGHHHGSDRRRRHAAHGHPIRHTRRGAPDPATSLRTLTAWSHGERRLCACSSPVPARRPPLRRALGACISSACTPRRLRGPLPPFCVDLRRATPLRRCTHFSRNCALL